MSENYLQTNAANFVEGRQNHKIIIGVLHRTGNKGIDTAQGEANYSHAHAIKASYYKVIDYLGKIWRVTQPTQTEFATDDWVLNEESLNYELAGENGTPVTSAAMNALIADVKADPAAKGIAPVRLTLAQIKARNVSGWCDHADITEALGIVGGHTDAVSPTEFTTFLKGIAS